MKGGRPLSVPLILSLTILLLGCAVHTPDYCCQRDSNAYWDIEELYGCAQSPDHPLTLTEIMQIALCNNLDVRLQELELAVQCETVKSEKMRQLGQLNARGELTTRDRNTGSSSDSLTNRPPAPPSISSEKDHGTFEIRYVFDLLDFGLSYYSARQQTNKYLQIQQRHLRARQNLLLDVYRAFYRAHVAKRAMERSADLLVTLRDRQQQVQRQVEERTVSQMRGLLQEDRIVDIEIKLYAFENEYRSALAELQALMGMPLSCSLELANLDVQGWELPHVEICELEWEALSHRPELLGQDMQVCIDVDEIRRSILDMYPNVALFGGYNYDDNKYLVYSNWLAAGMRATHDLLSIPSKMRNVTKNRYQYLLDKKTRLSMSLGILTQVHLAYINVQETKQQLQLATELDSVKQRMFKLSEAYEESGEYDDDDVMDYEIEALFAELTALKAYANHQVALEQLSNAIGRPLQFTPEDLGCQMWDIRQQCDASLYDWCGNACPGFCGMSLSHEKLSH